jgi:uncharacterized phage protein (TIGR02218 family)
MDASVEDGDVREIYTFSLASSTYTLTQHAEDIVFDSVTYTATPGLTRGDVFVSDLTQHREIALVLPRNHPVVLALVPIAPRVARVSIVQLHTNATTADTDRSQIWYGEIAALDLSTDEAQLTIPGALDIVFDMDLPVLRAQRTCQHQLYSVGCTVLRNGSNVKTPTVSAVSGIEISCSSLASWIDQTARGGEVLRVSDGERRTILDQVGNDLVIDVPFGALAPGDSIEVTKGCNKQVSTCRGDFLNIKNFGGHPLLPTRNPASPTGRGVG